MREHQLDQRVVLGVGAVAPVDPVGLGQGGDLVDPLVAARQAEAVVDMRDGLLAGP